MRSFATDQGRMLITYLRPQLLRVVCLALLLVGSIGLQLINPQILKSFIDSASADGSDSVLALAAGLFLAVALVQQLLSVGATYLSEYVGWGATNALRADLLLHCLRLDQSFHKAHTPGELIERIDGDVTALANFFSQLVIQVAGNLLLLVGVLAILWGIDWRVGLLFVATAVLVLLTLTGLQTIASPLWKVARQRSAELFGFIEERLAATEDITSSGAGAYTMRRLAAHLGSHLRAQRQALLTGRLGWASADVLFTLGTAACYLLAAQLYQGGALTIGTIYIIFFYSGLLFRPLTQITRQAEDFQKASAGIARVQELLAIRSALAPSGDTPLPAGPLAVAFRGVSFAYQNDETSADQQPESEQAEAAAVAGADQYALCGPRSSVLRNVSFSIAPGEVLGVVGRTGSGKTTLTRLLFRLYDPQDGAIEVGGIDIRKMPLGELRQRVGIVTQEVQLFHATVRDNLTLFDEGIPDVRILGAIDALGLRPWYETLDDGLDTMLTPGGGLSAGQAQLLAFTRIFLRDPGLVILDEASSRLDPATERLIEGAVEALLANRSGIIIAHRLHTVQRADAILVLEAGSVVEHGEREELLGTPDSRFSTLVRRGLEERVA